MPFSSTEIASLTGGFNQQIMLQQQQAAMITQQFGGYSPNPYAHPAPTQGEQFSGMLMQGMGQVGMSALGSQRLNTMGAGIAAPMAQTGQFLMGQMMYGANQQQMLDSNLRTAYRFPNAFGGRGFTGTDTATIGSSLRQMSHMRGPGGETTSFDELGQLASNMGRMGMAEGVRSVKDFNEKFKQMLNSVKTIATELGTSLEEAQKVMASMKGSGIFRNQGQFAGMIRQGALAGNMSTAEMSSAALMGAQISRSIGGLGRAGAMAGVQTLSNIGSATQAGVMSEEDIYNVTGLTGAEGRQAMAQNMMSGDARFFSGGLGRRVLASIAGKDGRINQDDVMAYMSGGVSTGETMGMAHRNLGKVGRANFIRNEGRLRGEAMAAFGGLGKAVVARNWLEERGMNMNEMDDRSMLFFQRKFGVGRDEADQLIKMARNMDTILAHRQKSSDNDQFLRQMDQADRASKPEEIVKRLEMARNEVNDGLRELGASFYKSMSTSIGEFIGKMSGEYVQKRRTAIAGIANQMMRGGPGTDDMVARELGIRYSSDGKASTNQLSIAGRAVQGTLFGDGNLTGAQFNRVLGANAQKFRDAGYDITGAKSMADLNQIQQRAFQASVGFNSGGDLGTAIDTETLDKFRTLAAKGGLTGSGDKFMEQFQTSLDSLKTGQSKELSQLFRSGSAADRGRIMSSFLEQAGVRDAFADRMGTPTALGGRGSQFATLDAENRAIGNLIVGNRGRFGAAGAPSIAERVRTIGGDASLVLGGSESVAGKMIGSVTGFLGGKADQLDSLIRPYTADTATSAAHRASLSRGIARSPRSLISGLQKTLDPMGLVKGAVGDIGEGLGQLTGGIEEWGASQIRGVLGEYDDTDKQAIGEFLKGEEGRSLAGTILSGDSEAQRKTIKDIQTRRIKLSNQKGRTKIETAELEGLRALEAMGRVRAAGAQPSKEQLQKIAEDTGFGSVEAMLASAGGAEATAIEEQRRDATQIFEGMGMKAREDSLLNIETDKDINKGIESGEIKVGAAALDYRKRMRDIAREQSEFTGDSSQEGYEANVARYGRVRSQQAELERIRTGGSIADRRKMARDMAKLGMGGEASRMMSEINAEEKLTRGAQRGTEGTLEAVAGSLGVDFRKGDFKGLHGTAGVNELMNRMGLGEGSNVKNRDQIQKELQAIVGAKDLSPAEKGQRLAALQGRQEIVDGQREQQNKQAESRDPSFRRLGEVKEAVTAVKASIDSLKSATLTVRDAGKATE